MITLSRDKKYHQKCIHRLVLFAFVGPPPSEKHECCHNDGDPSNNNLSNLRWGTKKENQADRKVHGTLSVNVGISNGQAKLAESNVREIRKMLEARELLQREIADHFGVSANTIRDIKTGRCWSHVI